MIEKLDRMPKVFNSSMANMKREAYNIGWKEEQRK